MNKKWIVPVGFTVGVLNGLFGAGGGTVLVPALEKMELSTHKAHATALAVMLPLSVLSVCIYIGSVQVDWPAALYVSVGGVAGGVTGARLLNRLKSNWLHTLFGLCMAAAALRMLFAG